MTMIERLATAINDARAEGEIAQARAALNAMREPTQDMETEAARDTPPSQRARRHPSR